VATYMVVLFWLLAFMSGAVGTYGVTPHLAAVVGCVALLVTSLVCSCIGLIKGGMVDRLWSISAVALLVVPMSILVARG